MKGRLGRIGRVVLVLVSGLDMREINIYILLVCRRTDKFTLVPQPGYNPLKDGSNPTQKMQLILNCEKRFLSI